jgi:hypothetical protein
MDYIADRTLFKAVMFARHLMRKGEAPAVANAIAARYYGVHVSDVAHYTGQVGAYFANRRRR